MFAPFPFRVAAHWGFVINAAQIEYHQFVECDGVLMGGLPHRHLERRLSMSGLERCPGCHPERSEGSLRPVSQTLRGVYPERSEWAQSLP